MKISDRKVGRVTQTSGDGKHFSPLCKISAEKCCERLAGFKLLLKVCWFSSPLSYEKLSTDSVTRSYHQPILTRKRKIPFETSNLPVSSFVNISNRNSNGKFIRGMNFPVSCVKTLKHELGNDELRFIFHFSIEIRFESRKKK
jgi:hypothetical protein